MIVLVSGLAAACTVRPVDLSPGSWPADYRARIEAAEEAYTPLAERVVEGRSGLVAGTASPVAVHVGMEVLRQGGSAADAAVATALTGVMMNDGATVSYAGIVQGLYYDAATGEVHVLDGSWKSYAGETDPASIPDPDLSSVGGPAPAEAATVQHGRKTLVPGFMAGMQALHDRFGVLPWAELFEPAIWYADNGVPVTTQLASFFKAQEKLLNRTKAGRDFAHPDGELPRFGSRHVQPELAATLRGVAAEGAAYMYTGDWGRRYVEAVVAEGGKATLEDMASYEARWSAPDSVAFDGGVAYGHASDNPGGCTALGALALLNALDVGDRPPYWRDATTFRAYADALWFAQVGRYSPASLAFEAEHGFAPDCSDRLTPEYAEAVAPRLGDLAGAPTQVQAEADHHTFALVVVDRAGNVAALSHSINTITWGDTGIVVGGVPIANAASMNKGQLARLAPGSRAVAAMAPVILIRNGRPVVAAATVGSSLHQETVRMIAGVAHGVPLTDLQKSPPIVRDFSDLSRRVELVPSGRYAGELLDAVRAGGVEVREGAAAQVHNLRGIAAVAVLDPDGRMWSAEVPGVYDFVEAE